MTTTPPIPHYTFRQIQTSTKWLTDLPIAVTRYGRVYAYIASYFMPELDAEAIQSELDHQQKKIDRMNREIAIYRAVIERNGVDPDSLLEE